MSSQGWKPGQGLGARDAKHFNSNPIPKVAISYKDDTLGLGATLKSRDAIHTRTGLDAFQGLLGRLNGKSDYELEKEIKKSENRKLAMWAQGRWGGVVFVPGGTLVQGDGFKKTEEEDTTRSGSEEVSESQNVEVAATERAERKEERRRRREKKKLKKEAKSAPKDGLLNGGALKNQSGAKLENLPDSKEEKKRKRKDMTISDNGSIQAAALEAVKAEGPESSGVDLPAHPVVKLKNAPTLPRNSRHIIRGRNIQAKKMAFSDLKMLDQVQSFPFRR